MKSTGDWTGRGGRAWAGGAAPGGLGRGGGGSGGGGETEYTDGEGQTDLAWEQRTRQEGVGTDESAEAPGRFEKIRRTLGGGEDTQRGKDAGSSRAWAPAVEERVGPSRVPRHRRVSVLGGTLAARGSVSQFQNREPEKEGGKGGYRREKGGERPLRPRVNSDPAPGPSSHSPLDAGPGARGPGGPGSVSWRGSPGCAWTGRAARV